MQKKSQERFDRSASSYERERVAALTERIQKAEVETREMRAERRRLINSVCQRDKYRQGKTLGIRNISERISAAE